MPYFFFVLIYPFIPGSYDPVGISLSTFIQLYSGLGLITCIPAVLWLYHAVKIGNANKDDQYLFKKYWLFPKIYIWTSIFVLSIVIFITTFGLSRLAGIFLFLAMIFFSGLFFNKISQLKPGFHPPHGLPLALALLPILLLVFQLSISKPLTNWSRARAIHNSSQLIDEIERYKNRYGKYPLTLNAIYKDYQTGINSIEEYHYTYDNTMYNLYFEQPRFLFDQIGTREFVVYNPKDNHLMFSHVSWHMLFEPDQLRRNQGWYASYDTGVPHWKYFWFY